jgi:putative hydrolase of the HAD superfamily
MIDKSINSIIFDFGGVLINIDYKATIRAFKELGIENFDAMYTQANQSNLFNDIETGKISIPSFINRLLDYLPSGTSPNKVVEAWNKMILNVPKENILLLNRLKKEGYSIFLLSNTNEIHIKKALQEWDKVSTKSPDEIFDKVYYSFELQMRKPNRVIYDFVCEEQELDPEQTLFIDDSIQHINGALLSGLQTFHLTSDKSILDYFS